MAIRIAACENIAEYCGPERDVTLNSIGDTFSPNINEIPEGYKCTYNIKTTCGAPSFIFEGNAITGELVVMALEYTDDARVTLSDTYPVPSTDVFDTSDYCLSSSPYASFCSEEVSYSYYPRLLQNTAQTPISLESIMASYETYRLAKDKYNNDVTAAKNHNQWDDLLELFGLPAKNEPYPEYIGLYTGNSFTNTNSVGGYGWPTSRMIDLSFSGTVYGAIGTNGDTQILSAIDYNKQTCIDRHLVISFIPIGTPATAGNAAGLFKAVSLQTNYLLDPPTPAYDHGTGAIYLAFKLTGVMLAAYLAL